MFRPPLANPAQKRTLRPLYANHQATPYGGFLDPDLNVVYDIYPGTVMKLVYGEVFAPCEVGDTPFGLSAFFVNTAGYGGHQVDEVSASGTGLYTVWVGGPQAVFEILAPAFDTTADWATAAATPAAPLTWDAEGKLTTGGGAGTTIAELIDVISPEKIVVRLLGAAV